MFAQCPLCNAIFKVTAGQLGAAHGQVRCGSCRKVFDAIEHLRDDAFVEGAAGKSLPKVRSEPVGSKPVVPEAAVSAGVPDDGSRVGVTPDPSPRSLPDTQGLSVIRPAVADRARAASALRSSGKAIERGRVPDSILADLERWQQSGVTRRKALAFGAGGALMLVVLGLQAVWFDPVRAWRNYPQWYGYIDSFCKLTGCVLPQRRDLSLIRLLSRDVRVHPRYEGALQITATLLNGAPFQQPYPHMSFTLFNVNGQTIASRTFAPTEYLGAPLDDAAMFEPGIPVQLGLQVLAPEVVAVSFEFKFL